MTSPKTAWPHHGGPAYEELASRFRPVFETIRQGAAERDRERELPRDAVRHLREARFGAVRVPRELGGLGVTLPDLFALLIELAEADSNLAQILRAHFGSVEGLVFGPENDWSRTWLRRVAKGDILSAGWTEPGEASWRGFSTEVSHDGRTWRLNGRKYYTTGALFADWIHVGATRGENETVRILVPTDAPGLSIVDDWNGFGQTLTASGTAVFDDVEVRADDIRTLTAHPPFMTAFYQIVHLATLAGIGRALATEASRYVSERKRTFSHASATVAREDPLVLQLLGRVHAQVYAANALTLSVAEALGRAAGEAASSSAPADVARLDIEVYQAQIVVSESVLSAASLVFNALGASALDRDRGLDRFWRNARTIASHNPLIYKERIVGDYVVNGTEPPKSWLSGVS